MEALFLYELRELKKLPFRSSSNDGRPREKLLEKGKFALSDAELIAILIRSANKEYLAVTVLQQLLHQS